MKRYLNEALLFLKGYSNEGGILLGKVNWKGILYEPGCNEIIPPGPGLIFKKLPAFIAFSKKV